MSRPLKEVLVVGGVKVQPTAKYVVKPDTPTEEHWMRLSNLDRVVNPTFSSAILFYSKVLVRTNRTFAEIVQSLKESLATALVHFYPFAGRLALRDDGLVDLHCNDQGAIVIEAVVDADLDELGGPQPMPALSGLEIARLGPGPRYVPDQLQSMPTLVIQVTQFKRCGSVAVVANWHHTVADGTSGCHFIKSWSEVALGKEISLKPNHDRELLRPRGERDSSMVTGYSTRNIQDLLTRPDSTKAVPSDPVTLKSFPLSRKAISSLKAQAKKDGKEYTSVESISGHLWQTMTNARVKEDESADDQVTRFFIFVDGRKKLDMPPGYFGNVVCSACAVSTEKEVATKPVSYATRLIHDSVKSISGDYFRSLIDWVEEQGKAPPKSEHMNSLGRDVAATFWIHFPLYEVDFGWGKPDLVARNSSPRPFIDGIAMMSNRDGSGMVAIVNIHSDRLARLETNPEFSNSYYSQPSISDSKACSSLGTTCTLSRKDHSLQHVNNSLSSAQSSVQTSSQTPQVPSQFSLLDFWSFCVKFWITVLALTYSIIGLALSLAFFREIMRSSGSVLQKADGDGLHYTVWERLLRLQGGGPDGGLLPKIAILELVRGAWHFCMRVCITVLISGRTVARTMVELAIILSCPNYHWNPIIGSLSPHSPAHSKTLFPSSM